jgi:iron complex transport system substrate-binding protein
MEQAGVVDANTEDDGSFFFEWSPERADELASDVFVSWVPEAGTVEQIEADPLLGQIPAVRNGTLVADSNNTLTLAISAASPLSLPWALEEFVPPLAAAAEQAAAAR